MITATIIEKAFFKREHLFCSHDTNAFRIFNSLGDGKEGLIIDYYNGFILIQLYDSSLYHESVKIADYCKAILKNMSITLEGILLKDRTKVNDPQRIADIRKSSLVLGSMPPVPFAVKQNNCLAYVDIIHGQNTGLFLDMRSVRKRLSDYYKNGGKLCNLFCYTGLFSVHALKSGLNSAVNVDISRTVLNKAKQNYELNEIQYDSRDFVKADSKDFLRLALKKKLQISFIIFDPPTFSRNRSESFSVKKHYKHYISLIEQVLINGYVLTTINAVSISEDDYEAVERWCIQHESD